MFKNEVENIVKNKRFFGTLAWLGAGRLAGVPSGLFAPVLGWPGVPSGLTAPVLGPN